MNKVLTWFSLPYALVALSANVYCNSNYSVLCLFIKQFYPWSLKFLKASCLLYHSKLSYIHHIDSFYFKYFCIYFERQSCREGETETEKSSICWFTLQIAVKAWSQFEARSLELHLSFANGWWTPKHLHHLLLLFPGHSIELGWIWKSQDTNWHLYGKPALQEMPYLLCHNL